MNWKFQDAPNVAVITDKKIISGHDWIAYVSHDEDDGGWQFLSRGPMSEDDAAVVSLRSIVEIDHSIGELADMPLGWSAWRTEKDAPWQRKRTV